MVGWRAPLKLIDLGRTDISPNGLHVPLYVRISMLYLLVVPTFYGIVIMQNDMRDYIRDLVPLIYMFIPLLLIGRFKSDPEKWLKVFIVGLCIVGALFSLRFFIESDSGLTAIGNQYITSSNRDDLMQDVAVLYFLSFSSCFGLWLVLRGRKVLGLSVLGVATIPWAVMFASVLRAPVGLTTIAVMATFSRWLVSKEKHKGTNIIIFLLVLSFLAYYGQSIFEIVNKAVQLLLLKQQEYGLNARNVEAAAVIDNIDSIPTLLFGEGWGGLIANPIGGGAKWRFVHNFLMYSLFKVGLIGAIAIFFYFFWFLRLALKVNYKNNLYFLVAVAMVCPLSISMMLEASYKSLSFGLVLSFFPLLAMLSKKRNTFPLNNKVAIAK